MSKLIKFCAYLSGALALLVVALLANTLFFAVHEDNLIVQRVGNTQGQDLKRLKFAITQDQFDAALQRFSKGLQFQTISHEEPYNKTHVGKWDLKQFDNFLDHLKTSYPLIHSKFERVELDCHTVLMKWVGSNADLTPFLLMSHIDVVPVEVGTESSWKYPPFSGTVAEGFIWGRGTLDDKSGVFSILEAVEYLLAQGFTPERTMYITFGHDEEVGGRKGAILVAQYFESHNIRLEYVLDEGGSRTKGIFPGVSAPVSLIGISEKGYLSLLLKVEVEGGHSSMPSLETPIGILSTAISKIQQNQMPATITPIVSTQFRILSQHMSSFVQKVVLTNLWLFEWLLVKSFESKPGPNSIIRTTAAPTIFQSGTKDNVLPKKAEAVINFRTLPGDTIAHVIEHVISTVQDPRVSVSMFNQNIKEASPISDIHSLGYHVVKQTILEVFPGEVVTPHLVTGGTDSRYFYNVSNNVFRFLPFQLEGSDLPRIHGTNERLSVSNYKEMIHYFFELIQNSQNVQLAPVSASRDL